VDRIERLLKDPAHIQTAGLWTSAILAGFTSVAFAKLFRSAEAWFQHLAARAPYSPLFLSPLMFLAAWFVVRKYAPEASGSGIPQIMAANEIDYSTHRAFVNRLLGLRTAVVKVLSSLLCILGGGAIGREGPTLQISTSVFHFFGRQVRRFLPNVSEHTWVVAGAAAGLASAFNTPLGGIVYAIEELGLVHFHKIRTALISGVIVSGLVAQWILGSYLYLGFPKLMAIPFSFLPASILNGVVSGLLGALFGRILIGLVNYRLSFKKTSHLAGITMLSGLVMAALLVCDRRAGGTGIDLTMDFLFNGETSSLFLVAARFFGTIAAYLSGAAGGIFSPSLSIGATVGSYLAALLGSDHANLMVLLGMIGFLTGVTRTPFTSFILVLEMTDRHSAIFPMMLAAVTAQWVAHLIDSKSFYEHMKEKYVQQAKSEAQK
jgi:H+/Cl- antiporter ClcA